MAEGKIRHSTEEDRMHITDSALSLNVSDVEGSARWVEEHLGFQRQMAADGFVSLRHPEAGFNLIYLRTGLETFKPASVAGGADGLLVVFVVGDVDAEYARLAAEGVLVSGPIPAKLCATSFLP